MRFFLTPENASQFQRIPRFHQRLGNYDGHRLWCVGVRLWLGSLSLSEPCLFLPEPAKNLPGASRWPSMEAGVPYVNTESTWHESTRGAHHQVVAEKHQHW